MVHGARQCAERQSRRGRGGERSLEARALGVAARSVAISGGAHGETGDHLRRRITGKSKGKRARCAVVSRALGHELDARHTGSGLGRVRRAPRPIRGASHRLDERADGEPFEPILRDGTDLFEPAGELEGRAGRHGTCPLGRGPGVEEGECGTRRASRQVEGLGASRFPMARFFERNAKGRRSWLCGAGDSRFAQREEHERRAREDSADVSGSGECSGRERRAGRLASAHSVSSSPRSDSSSARSSRSEALTARSSSAWREGEVCSPRAA